MENASVRRKSVCMVPILIYNIFIGEAYVQNIYTEARSGTKARMAE